MTELVTDQQRLLQLYKLASVGSRTARCFKHGGSEQCWAGVVQRFKVAVDIKHRLRLRRLLFSHRITYTIYFIYLLYGKYHII